MTARTRSLAALRNLGPATARRLAELGIADEGGLRQLGAVAAYRRLKFAYPRETTLVALYALHGALTETHWNALPAEVKRQLREAAAGGAGDKRRRDDLEA